MDAEPSFNDSVRATAARAHDRLSFWSELASLLELEHVLEIGVFDGRFAEHMLRHAGRIRSYHMIDPWRHLGDWNKPANVSDQVFEDLLSQVRQRTAFAADKVKIHRGRTTEVIDEIDDRSLDLCYIDADHSLRGIAIDLIRAYGKVRPGGLIGGDDCIADSIVQHGRHFEPTLVFPFVAYFAEAQGHEVWFLPHNQFLMRKVSRPFRIVDLVGSYGETSLRGQLEPGRLFRRYFRPRR